MSILFQDFSFGPIKIRNRFIRSATSENLCDKQGLPNSSMIKLYRDLAKNELGMINTGVIRPEKSWFGPFNVPTLKNKSDLPTFRKLTDAVHEFGGKITAQLTPYFSKDSKFLAPSSPLPGLPGTVEQPIEATVSDIQKAIDIYGKLSSLIRSADFDAVQLHAAHGYGLHQFLSPYTNRRNDKYGGSLENRFRIIKEIRERISKEAGDDFPVWIKLTTGDFLDGAMGIDDAVEIAKLAEEHGFFSIEPSCGSLIGDWKSRGPNDKAIWEEGFNIDRIAKIKYAVNIPVVAVGGFRRLEYIEKIIEDGKADLVAMSRPLLAEPDLIKRWLNGDLAPSVCNTCDACFEYFWNIKPIRCANNKKYWNYIHNENND